LRQIFLMFLKQFTALLTIALMLLSALDLHAGPLNSPNKPKQDFGGEYIPFQMPELFTFDELLELGILENIRPPLKAKLDRVLTIPFISNEAYYNGSRPVRPNLPGLGPSLRVVMWNIERGLRLDDIKALFTNKEQFLKRIDTSEVKPESDEYKEILKQIDVLQNADVLVLQELDWGMKRTGYREVVRELGEALKMNWAYGVEFVEIDPINLGVEEFEEALPEDRDELHEQISINESNFKGLHGTAILSRYPIKQARLQPLRVQGYDWYNSERKRVSFIEKGKRLANEAVFLEKIAREIRRGGRTLLSVTLEVPDLPEGELTVAAPHLENHCKPERRRDQMREVLSYLRDIKNPVIMAGDLNTSLTNTTPTSLKREFTRRVGSGEFWVKQGIKYATGAGLFFDVLATGINFIKNQQDPTVKHVPIIAPNPEETLFRDLERFRFVDGYAFDFRGNSRRSFNGFGNTLANSNQRAPKGFAYTYELERAIGPVGKLKLDWIFVKPYINRPRDKRASYRFAPHYGRTLEEVNYSVDDRISDHNPISVDLPFNEPETLE
jgi:endonuclease/exonuclease/phosphatase family metal-dependent hydrolase